MNGMMKLGLLLSGLFFLCSSFSSIEMNKEDLYGHWIFVGNAEGVQEYKKVKAFELNKGGIAFREGGLIIKRQNAGFCGTPPISYQNVRGNWKELSSSKIEIAYQHWAGRQTETWEIVELTEEKIYIRLLRNKRK